MKIFIAIFIALFSQNEQDKPCKLQGNVKVVLSHADYKVRVVQTHPDLKVKFVQYFPDKPGEWKLVNTGPEDFTIQFVQAGEDFTIQNVDHWPGCF